MFSTGLPPASGLSAMSRRGFLAAMALGAARVAVGEDPARRSHRTMEAAQADLAEMVQTAKTQRLDPHENDLPVQWPKNTVVYPSNIQERVSIMEEDGPAVVTRRLTQAMTDPKNASLFEAFQTMQDGIVGKLYGSHYPLAPIVPPEQAGAAGWKKSENGQKQRYVLMITGEGTSPQELREHLAQWKNPKAAHETDQKFVDFLLNDQPNTNLILGYRNKLRQESWYRQSTELMREALAEAFEIPHEGQNVLVDRNLAGNSVLEPTDETRMVVLLSPKAEQVERVMKNWVASRQGKDAELLIFYNGHGDVAEEHATDRRQGADEGQLWLRGEDNVTDAPVGETQWKEWLHRHAAGFGQVAVVLDCCHSGAFFAKNATTSSFSALA